MVHRTDLDCQSRISVKCVKQRLLFDGRIANFNRTLIKRSESGAEPPRPRLYPRT